MDKQQAKQRLPLFVPPPTTTTSLAFPSYLVRLSSFLSLRHLFSLYHGSYIYCILRPWHRSSYHRVLPLSRFLFRRPDSFSKLERSKVFYIDLSKKNDEPEEHSIEFVESVVPFLLLFPSSLSSLDFSAIIFKSPAKMIFDLFLSTNARQRLKKVKIWQ